MLIRLLSISIHADVNCGHEDAKFRVAVIHANLSCGDAHFQVVFQNSLDVLITHIGDCDLMS